MIVGALLIFGNLPIARAVENFSLTTSPGRTQEGDPAGISLTLSVTNAMYSPPTTYVFTWTVIDPSGTSKTFTQSQLSTQSSWLLTANYPTNFAGSLNLVGTYRVSVAETLPSVNSAIPPSQFQIGLTDSPTYQRTYSVSIIGTGYSPAENVTVDLNRGPNIVSGFPTSTLADASGRVSLTWPSPPAISLGNYTVALSGSTVKTPVDSQWFVLYPTNVTIVSSWTSSRISQRTQTVEFRFNATYLSGIHVTSGTSTLNVVEPDGLTSHSVMASYNPALATFRAYYTTSLASAIGPWTWKIPTDSFDDGFRNGGPLTSSSDGFNIQSAALNVNVLSYGSTFSSGTTIPIYAMVIMPSSANFTQGTVTATMSSSGQRVGTPMSLVYDASSGRWSGSYKVSANDPSGTWVVAVTATDIYGNSGQSVASLNVNTPGPSQPAWYATWSFLLVVLVAVGIGVGILILRRKEVIHREVKLDVTAIKHQADQVKSDDFLQSIQAQLKKRAERLAAEHDAAEKEKHD